MKKSVSNADQHTVIGPIPRGTVLYDLLRWIARRVARRLNPADESPARPRDNAEKSDHIHEIEPRLTQ